MKKNELDSEIQIKFIRNKISKKFPKSALHLSNYEEIEEVNNSRFKNLSEVSEKTFFYDHRVIFLKVILILTIILAVVINDFYEDIYSNTTKSFAFWSIIVIFIIIMLFLYAFFFKRKSICITTSTEYLIINSKQKVYWTDVLTTGVFETSGLHNRETSVIIGTKDKIFTVKITDSELTAEDIIQIIHLHKNAT